MAYLEQFQLNVFTSMILVILLIVIKNRMRVESYGKQLLNTVIIMTLIAIIMEPLAWMFDGREFIGAYFLEYISNAALIILAPIISSLMLSYVRHQLQGLHRPLIKQIFRFVPFWFTVIMLIVNLFYPVYFYIGSADNVFHPGEYTWIHYVLILGIYFYMITITMVHGKKKHSKMIIIFIFFFFLPILGMIVQLLHVRINYSWNFIVLSILVIFLFLESADGELDFLTGLFNRRSYELYVSQLIQRNQPFQVVYIDLDKFKHINDEHGHLSGDKVLIEFSEHIKQTFQNGPMVARLGGDEYMIVIEHVLNIEETISALRESLKQGSEYLSNMKFSYGVQSYQQGMTVDQLYAAVDKKMYQYKRANNNLKRRRSDDRIS